jgi:hypothetical protein
LQYCSEQQALSMRTLEFLLLAVPQYYLQKFPNSCRPVILVIDLVYLIKR